MLARVTSFAISVYGCIRHFKSSDRAGAGLSQPQEMPGDGGADRPAWEPSRLLERLDIRSVDDFRRSAPEVVEDADTFAGNARKKASELARHSRSLGLADDSGLTVDALGGAPGVFSATYAGEPTR